MATIAQMEANQKNALLSTGPATQAGKAVSSRNNFRHGLCGPFTLLPWENEADYKTLERELAEEHRPETQTQRMLVRTMTESYWLRERAIKLQEICFRRDIPLADQPAALALYLRYQTTHERAFNKALAQLLKLKEESPKLVIGFESQQYKRAAHRRKEAEEKRRQEVHERRLAMLNLKIQGEERKNSARVTLPLSTPAPDNPAQRVQQAA